MKQNDEFELSNAPKSGKQSGWNIPFLFMHLPSLEASGWLKHNKNNGLSWNKLT
jgi:hypothetical protein